MSKNLLSLPPSSHVSTSGVKGVDDFPGLRTEDPAAIPHSDDTVWISTFGVMYFFFIPW